MSKFEIRRDYPGRNASLIIPFAAVRGLAIMRDTNDITGLTGAPARGHVEGFLCRDVVVGGPSDINRAGVFPGRLELPDTVGNECSLRLADQIECEGTDYVMTSGVAAVTTATAVGTKMSFEGGKVCVAQAGDVVWGTLSGQLTPEDAGNVRITVDAAR